MSRNAESEIGVYSAADNSEALELERACAQGSSYRMSFRRSTFHRRAENFGDWRIFTARSNGRLAGVVAVAIKDAVLLGGAPSRDRPLLPGARSTRGVGVRRALGRAAALLPDPVISPACPAGAWRAGSTPADLRGRARPLIPLVRAGHHGSDPPLIRRSSVSICRIRSSDTSRSRAMRGQSATAPSTCSMISCPSLRTMPLASPTRSI